MARCPGQDQRFWKPEDIFEVKCPACKTSVELWKDEPKVKCPNCKHDIVNPKLDLGCAKWCQYAEECLGTIKQQDNTILSNKLIEYLRKITDFNQSIVHDSLETLRYADLIQVEEGGDPLIIKASAIFSVIYAPSQERLESPLKKDINIHDALKTYGITDAYINSICKILEALRSETEVDSIEFNIVWDSHQLSQLHKQTQINHKQIKISWKTTTGEQLAREQL